jgi:hypothetical protein|tara:strand:- start:1 stop:756 length:756 start_codon:yes stop_codon:yes gene_type:complete
MGSSTSTRSTASGMEASKKKTVSTMIGNNADRYAQKKLGITKTIANPNQKAIKGNVTGYMARNTGGNQMYGTQYQEARGEYLEKQGLATGRTVNYGPIDPATGKGKFSYTAYDSATQKDGKLTFTSQGRDAMQTARNKDIPLSKEMFESQKRFQLGLAAITGFMGIPLIPGSLVNQALTPYTDYVQKREGGFYNKAGLIGTFLPSNKNNQPPQNEQQQNEQQNNEFAKSERIKKQAGLGASSADKGRTFFA